MRNKIIISVIALSLLMTPNLIHTNQIESRPTQLNNSANFTNINILQKLRQQYILPSKEIIINTTQEKPRYDIKLSQKYQNLVYKLCEENNLSYEMILSIMYQESRFIINAVNINNNGTIDYGLFQLNSGFISTHRDRAIKYCGLSENARFNVLNPDHNIRAGIGGIIENKEYYIAKGVIDEDMLKYVSNSLNMGISGYEKYIKRTGMTSRSYSRQIYKNKAMLENTQTLINK